jgi:hypothetical protein
VNTPDTNSRDLSAATYQNAKPMIDGSIGKQPPTHTHRMAKCGILLTGFPAGPWSIRKCPMESRARFRESIMILNLATVVSAWPSLVGEHLIYDDSG